MTVALQGKPGEFRFTLEVTRAATGLKETIEMVGHVVPPEEVLDITADKENNNGSDPLDGSS